VIRSPKVVILILVAALVPLLALGALAAQRGKGGGGGFNRDTSSFDPTKRTDFNRGRPPMAPPTPTPEPEPTGTDAAPTSTDAAPTSTDAALTGTDAAATGSAAAPVAPPVIAPPAAPAAPRGPVPAGFEAYRVLSDRNMFLRTRGRPAAPVRYTPRVAPPENPDERIVLTGILEQGDQCVAFFEDSRSRKTTEVQVGSLVGRGHVAAITFDTVEYAYNGTTKKITVGTSLTGATIALSRPAAPSVSAAPPSGGPQGGGYSGRGPSFTPAASAPATTAAAGLPTVTGSAAPVMFLVGPPPGEGGVSPESAAPGEETTAAPAEGTGPRLSPEEMMREQLRQRRAKEGN
jgi:hypothetical protein